MNVEDLIGQVHSLRSRLAALGPVPSRLAACVGPIRTIIGVAACILFGALSLAAQGEQAYKGRICLEPDEPTAIWQNAKVMPQCNISRSKRRSRFVLYSVDSKTVYLIDGHTKPRDFFGKNVVVIGTLDQPTGTIQADEIFWGLAPKIARAKSVYILCDACPRGMAVAWQVAFEELSNWGRFEIVPDVKKADLVFLVSANPYLGDFVTRDGPDKRPVKVDITYMSVVDPHTGESLWNDSKQRGSLFVSKATKDLIDELKSQLQIEEHAGKS